MAYDRAPACLSMQNLLDRISKMPGADNGASISATPAVLSLLQSPRHLHVYAVRASADEILHVGALIHSYYERRNSSSSSSSSSSSRPVGAAIIVDDAADDDFKNICTLTTHVTGETPYNNDASTSTFSRVTIVRGPKPPSSCANKTIYDAALRASAASVRAALDELSPRCGNARVVWHAHADPALLLHVLQNTRNPPLDAITVFDALSFARNAITLARPGPGYGLLLLPDPWPLLFGAVSRLNSGGGVPLVFASNSGMRSDLDRHSTQQLLGLRDLFPVLLPESFWKQGIGRIMDQLLVGAFRLLAGGDLSSNSPLRVGDTVVAELKRRLKGFATGGWAQACVDRNSYVESAIVAAVQGALPMRDNAYYPLPVLAALKQMITNPTPYSYVSALSRLALGPHAPSFFDAPKNESNKNESDKKSSSRAAPGSDSKLWAVNATLNPRGEPLPPNTPDNSVIMQIVPSSTYVHVLTSPQPEVVQKAINARWERYVASMAYRDKRLSASSGTGAGEFGLSADTAKVWCAVVPGVFATAVEEWGKTVAERLSGKGGEKVQKEVKQLVDAARDSSFTKRCQRVLKG